MHNLRRLQLSGPLALFAALAAAEITAYMVAQYQLPQIWSVSALSGAANA
jgi:hypothetical protein